MERADLGDARVVGPAVRRRPCSISANVVGRRWSKTASARMTWSVSVSAGTGWNAWKPPGRNLVAITRPVPVSSCRKRPVTTPWIVGGVLEGDVHARVGDDLLRERLVEIPLDHPVALDQVGEVLGGLDAGEAEVPARRLGLQDARRRVVHVAFLQYGRAERRLAWPHVCQADSRGVPLRHARARRRRRRRGAGLLRARVRRRGPAASSSWAASSCTPSCASATRSSASATRSRSSGSVAPKADEPVPVSLMIYTEDVDALYAQAVEAGATAVNEPVRPVPRRPRRLAARPVRPPLDALHAHRGHGRGGDAAAHRGGDGLGRRASRG